MADTRLKEKAVATAFEYQQGNIAGLDDATNQTIVYAMAFLRHRHYVFTRRAKCDGRAAT